MAMLVAACCPSTRIVHDNDASESLLIEMDSFELSIVAVKDFDHGSGAVIGVRLSC